MGGCEECSGIRISPAEFAERRCDETRHRLPSNDGDGYIICPCSRADCCREAAPAIQEDNQRLVVADEDTVPLLLLAVLDHPDQSRQRIVRRHSAVHGIFDGADGVQQQQRQPAQIREDPVDTAPQ
jgi:hypothetical protein